VLLLLTKTKMIKNVLLFFFVNSNKVEIIINVTNISYEINNFYLKILNKRCCLGNKL